MRRYLRALSILMIFYRKMLGKLKKFLKRAAVKSARRKEDRYWIKRAEQVLAKNEPTSTLEEIIEKYQINSN